MMLHEGGGRNSGLHIPWLDKFAGQQKLERQYWINRTMSWVEQLVVDIQTSWGREQKKSETQNLPTTKERKG